MRRIILADLFSYNNEGVKTGHYFALARNYQNIFKDTFEVKIAGGEIYKTGFEDSELILLPCESYPNDSSITKRFNIFRNCRALMEATTKDDIIVFQVAKPASCVLALSIFGRKDRNVFLIEYDTSVLSSKIKRFVYQIAKRNLKGLICPAENIGEAYGLSYCVVSDYIYDKNPEELKFVPFEEKQYDYVMVGRIEPEKGILEVAKHLVGTPYKTLIAGKCENITLREELEKVCSSSDNIVLKQGFVSTDDYIQYIRKAKFVVLNYTSEYDNRSSGVVLDAIFNGTPVVGRKCGATQFLEDDSIGVLFDKVASFDTSIIVDKEQNDKFLDNIKQYIKQNTKDIIRLRSFIESAININICKQ